MGPFSDAALCARSRHPTLYRISTAYGAAVFSRRCELLALRTAATVNNSSRNKIVECGDSFVDVIANAAVDQQLRIMIEELHDK